MPFGSTSISSLTREQLRSQIVTSLFGRRAGLDANGYEVGHQDSRTPIDNITTTAATSLIPNGCSVLSATPASSAIYTMFQATAGVYKEITQISTPAVGFQIQLGDNAHIVTTAGTSFNQITIGGVGGGINMFCISSSTATGPIWITDGYVSTGTIFSTY
jgi:hypothetical protein